MFSKKTRLGYFVGDKEDVVEVMIQSFGNTDSVHWGENGSSPVGLVPFKLNRSCCSVNKVYVRKFLETWLVFTVRGCLSTCAVPKR